MWVTGGYGRQADVTAGLHPQLRKYPVRAGTYASCHKRMYETDGRDRWSCRLRENRCQRRAIRSYDSVGAVAHHQGGDHSLAQFAQRDLIVFVPLTPSRRAASRRVQYAALNTYSAPCSCARSGAALRPATAAVAHTHRAVMRCDHDPTGTAARIASTARSTDVSTRIFRRTYSCNASAIEQSCSTMDRSALARQPSVRMVPATCTA
jgi:hypothetical protein